jgi:hypothetical protein
MATVSSAPSLSNLAYLRNQSCISSRWRQLSPPLLRTHIQAFSSKSSSLNLSFSTLFLNLLWLLLLYCHSKTRHHFTYFLKPRTIDLASWVRIDSSSQLSSLLPAWSNSNACLMAFWLALQGDILPWALSLSLCLSFPHSLRVSLFQFVAVCLVKLTIGPIDDEWISLR